MATACAGSGKRSQATFPSSFRHSKRVNLSRGRDAGGGNPWGQKSVFAPRQVAEFDAPDTLPNFVWLEGRGVSLRASRGMNHASRHGPKFAAVLFLIQMKQLVFGSRCSFGCLEDDDHRAG